MHQVRIFIRSVTGYWKIHLHRADRKYIFSAKFLISLPPHADMR